jgi:hypothetical protein
MERKELYVATSIHNSFKKFHCTERRKTVH